MGKKDPKPLPEDQPLFDMPEQVVESLVRPPTFGIWTRHKAVLIDQYLKSFVWITRHGTYIDGFAGPKEPEFPETWAAHRVVSRHPADPSKRRIRHFHLCEVAPEKVAMLEELRDAHPGKDVVVYPHDFNDAVDDILTEEIIGPREASFCLLDQYSIECDWATVEKIAAFPKAEYKVEQFYFLGTGWLDRVLAATGEDKLEQWWGRPSAYEELKPLNAWERGEHIARRFKEELGYRFAVPWAIHDVHRGAGRIMYFMVHAADHPEAPKLMKRAYAQAVGPLVKGAERRRLFDD